LLQRDKIKHQFELDNEKKQFISQIKQIQKEDILPKIPEKLSLWKRIVKVLMG
jgi:hypothetical protein